MLDTVARRLVLPVNAKAEVVRPRRNNGRCPSVSVIIPCYNYGRYLTKCVNRVLDQQGVRLEVIVIDDASSDGSDQIVSQHGARETRYSTLPQKAYHPPSAYTTHRIPPHISPIKPSLSPLS